MRSLVNPIKLQEKAKGLQEKSSTSVQAAFLLEADFFLVCIVYVRLSPFYCVIFEKRRMTLLRYKRLILCCCLNLPFSACWKLHSSERLEIIFSFLLRLLFLKNAFPLEASEIYEHRRGVRVKFSFAYKKIARIKNEYSSCQRKKGRALRERSEANRKK